MKKATNKTALRIQAFLGDAFEVLEFDAGTRTAAEAADAIGCTVSQIAKSLVFRGKTSGEAILVVTSGSNRVDEKKVGTLAGEKIDRADADFVRAATGFAIGGVPPVSHTRPPKILLDADLQIFEDLWAAAGTPHAVFRLTPDQLATLTQAAYCDVARR